LRYYSYNEFISDLKSVLPVLKEEEFDAIVSIARGGATIGHFLSEALELRELYAINSILYDDKEKLEIITISSIPNLDGKAKVLIVDDICDSGTTLKSVSELLSKEYEFIDFKSLAIFYKDSAVFTPDFRLQEADDWIEFFWNVDLKEDS
jgi:xanthine phosphoribosyltransferase